MEFFLLRVIALAATCLPSVYSQSGCSVDDLADHELVANLLALSLRDSAGQVPLPSVEVLDVNTVCLATAPTFGLYRYASLVVSYNCQGTPPCLLGE